MRWISILSVFFVSFSQVVNGWQQPTSIEVLNAAKKELNVKFYRLQAEISKEGSLVLITMNGLFLDSEVRMFDRDVVIHELDLVESQETQIRKIVESWHDKIEDVKISFEKRVKNGERVLAIIQETDTIDEDFRNSILDELTPSQVKSYSQISFRFLIRLFGLYRVLGTNAVSTHLKFDESDLKTLRSAVRNERPQFESQRQKISRQYFEEFLNLLSVDERKRLESNEETKESLGDISTLRSFITIALENEEYRKRSAIQRLFSGTRFDFDSAGGFHIQVSDELDPGLEKGFFLKCFFANEFYQAFLEKLAIPNSTVFQLDQLRSVYFTAFANLPKQQIELPTGELAQSLSETDVNTVLHGEFDRIHQSLLKLLTKDQLFQVNEAITRSADMKLGPIVAILESRTKDDAADLSLKLNGLLKKIDQSVNALEDQMLMLIAEKMDSNVSSKFRSLVGPKITNSPSCIDCLSTLF